MKYLDVLWWGIEEFLPMYVAMRVYFQIDADSVDMKCESKYYVTVAVAVFGTTWATASFATGGWREEARWCATTRASPHSTSSTATTPRVSSSQAPRTAPSVSGPTAQVRTRQTLLSCSSW